MSKAFFKEVYKRYICVKCGVRPVFTSRAENNRSSLLCRSCYIAEATKNYKIWFGKLPYEKKVEYIKKRAEANKEWIAKHPDRRKIAALFSYYEYVDKRRDQRNAKRREYYKQTGK